MRAVGAPSGFSTSLGGLRFSVSSPAHLVHTIVPPVLHRILQHVLHWFVTIYKGTVWATWDKDAPEFLTYLGDVKEQFDLCLDHRDGREGGSECIGVHKWVFPSNWKFAAENFLGDTYHNPSHRSVDMIGIGPSGRSGVKGRRDDEYAGAQHLWISFPGGHG